MSKGALATPWLIDAWLARWRPLSEHRRAGPASAPPTRPAAVVTGASRGIGLAIAMELALRGATVVMIARNAAGLAAAARAINKRTGARPVVVPLDLLRPDATSVLDAALADAGLHADILVNNAGVGLAGAFVTHAPAALHELVVLNVERLTALSRHYLPAMLERGSGGIVNLASLGGYVSGPNQAAYYASKAYVIALSEAIAVEVAGRGVRITVVSPGPVDTGFHAAMGADRSLYRWLVRPMSPQRVARSAIAAFRWGRSSVVPGLTARMLSAVLWLTPRAVSARIVGLLLRLPTDRRDV